MTETLPLKLNWLRCPRCGGKTRTQLRPHTVLEDFPLFCPKCRYTCVIRFQNGKTEFIKKHPALADVCDVILSLLCGSFALLAFGIVWILEKLADARQGQEGRWRI